MSADTMPINNGKIHPLIWAGLLAIILTAALVMPNLYLASKSSHEVAQQSYIIHQTLVFENQNEILNITMDNYLATQNYLMASTNSIAGSVAFKITQYKTDTGGCRYDGYVEWNFLTFEDSFLSGEACSDEDALLLGARFLEDVLVELGNISHSSHAVATVEILGKAVLAVLAG